MKRRKRLVLALWGVVVLSMGHAWAGVDLDRACDRYVAADAEAEKACIAECDMKRKKILLRRVIRIQSRLDALGCDGQRTLVDLCGGVLDPEGPYYVSLSPTSVELEVGESAPFVAELVGPQCDGGGLVDDIVWFADGTIATVTSTGHERALVTGLSPGTAEIVAYAWALRPYGGPFGTAIVTVRAPSPTTTTPTTTTTLASTWIWHPCGCPMLMCTAHMNPNCPIGPLDPWAHGDECRNYYPCVNAECIADGAASFIPYPSCDTECMYWGSSVRCKEYL